MKTCAKCGKNVSDSTPLCPNCNSMAFHTEKGLEGGISELLMMLSQKSPTAFFIIFAILVLALVGGFLWLFGVI